MPLQSNVIKNHIAFQLKFNIKIIIITCDHIIICKYTNTLYALLGYIIKFHIERQYSTEHKIIMLLMFSNKNIL